MQNFENLLVPIPATEPQAPTPQALSMQEQTSETQNIYLPNLQAPYMYLTLPMPQHAADLTLPASQLHRGNVIGISQNTKVEDVNMKDVNKEGVERERSTTEDSNIAEEPARKKARVENEAQEKNEKMLKFQKALMGRVPVKNAHGETVIVQGILREKTRACNGGHAIIPFEHQKSACKRGIQDSVPRMLLCHDPGLGKTFTLLLMVAAMHVKCAGRARKTLVSSPTSCLDQWLNACLDSLRIPADRILCTNQLAKLTEKNIRKHDIIILSRDTVRRAYLQCYCYYSNHHQNDTYNWVSQWDRICEPPDDRPVPLHPIFLQTFDIFCIDEIHCLRNPVAAWTKGHELIASKAEKCIGMTATPVVNKPQDLIGISIAMDLPPAFKQTSSWFHDKAKLKVNLNTARELNKITDRVTDEILNLPPITDKKVHFDVCIDPSHVGKYNYALMKARRMRTMIELRGKATSDDLRRLMAMIQTMQQFVVSPILAENMACVVRESPELIKAAAEQETGALISLKDTIYSLNAEGFDHVLVACCHVAPIMVAEHYLYSKAAYSGDIVLYTGSLSQKKRAISTATFLTSKKAVMIMSIDAGGTGLHLVSRPSFPTAVVFWGSRPFSPMQIIQTRKRVHRIGQECPVKVVHLIADGSVDSAIDFVHGDKLTLAKAVVDNETSKLEESGGAWRTQGRIVDRCRLLTKSGQFAPEGADEDQILEGTLAMHDQNGEESQSDEEYEAIEDGDDEPLEEENTPTK